MSESYDMIKDISYSFDALTHVIREHRSSRVTVLPGYMYGIDYEKMGKLKSQGVTDKRKLEVRGPMYSIVDVILDDDTYFRVYKRFHHFSMYNTDMLLDKVNAEREALCEAVILSRSLEMMGINADVSGISVKEAKEKLIEWDKKIIELERSRKSEMLIVMQG